MNDQNRELPEGIVNGPESFSSTEVCLPLVSYLLLSTHDLILFLVSIYPSPVLYVKGGKIIVFVFCCRVYAYIPEMKLFLLDNSLNCSSPKVFSEFF